MSIKSLLSRWLRDRIVRVSILGDLDPEPIDDKSFDKALDQSEIEALFQSVLQEEQRDAPADRSVNR